MLRTHAEEIKRILIEYPETRDSDLKLFVELAKAHGANKLSLEVALLNLDRYGLPNWETVSRVRRKVQSECPELRASKKIQKYRAEKQNAFFDWSRE